MDRKASDDRRSRRDSSPDMVDRRRRHDSSPDPDRVANQLLVQVEKFKARVEAPKGKYSFGELLMPYDYDRLRSKFVKPEGLAPIDNKILFLRNFDQDNEFSMSPVRSSKVSNLR